MTMKIEVSNVLKIRDPSPLILEYCMDELIIPNPLHYKLEQMGKWAENEPRNIALYKAIDEENLELPFGCLNDIWRLHPDTQYYSLDLAPKVDLVKYKSKTQLRDYQAAAVGAAMDKKGGIIVSPCGSGKTTMGLEIIARHGQRALWITHTIDLLNQSMERAKEFLGLHGGDGDGGGGGEIGSITAGKAKIGTHITFATVQTLSKWVDIAKHKYTWPVIIVDESHRAYVSAKSAGMFHRCLSSFAARHKYGLTATAHRSDGLIRGMYALIGDLAYMVPQHTLADKVVPVKVQFRATDYDYSDDVLDVDGTIIFSKLQEDIALDDGRNQIIVDDLVQNQNHYNLILSDRLFHLNMLRYALPPSLAQSSSSRLIDGKTPKTKREQAIKDMRDGKAHYLFATYALAKEGLDLPRLDRLYMALPKKDYAVVIQSAGRIARVFEGKADAIVYDYVDPVGMCKKMYQERLKHYKKHGYETNLLVLGRSGFNGRKDYEYRKKTI